MAKKIVICSIGASSPNTPHDLHGSAQNEYLVQFWQREIDLVLPDCPDLILLPEHADRFVDQDTEPNSEDRAQRSDALLHCLRGIACEHSCYIAYGTSRLQPDGDWKNAALLVGRRGEILVEYHKNHPVISEIEDFGITCGTEASVVETEFGRIGLAICFDLNFEELRLKYEAARLDLLLFPSLFHGGLMQPYWAYSCRTHFVSCVGVANLPSEIYSPVGHRIAGSTNYFSTVTATINLDCIVVHLDNNIQKLKCLKQKYGADVTVFDPGQLGSVLVTSESTEISATKMIHAFDIESLDNYLARSRQHYNAAQTSKN
ncbi:MAG: carbon-nitrogen hydrolase family protein [Abditibacteriaceae bacterium]